MVDVAERADILVDDPFGLHGREQALQLGDPASNNDGTKAYAERERKSLPRITAQLSDLEARALAALARGREDLAVEAAAAIAQLEAERTTTETALATYEVETARLRA